MNNSNKRIAVEFDITIGHAGWNQIIWLPKGHSTKEADVIEYIQKYLEIVNGTLDRFIEKKRIFDGILEIKEMTPKTPLESFEIMVKSTASSFTAAPAGETLVGVNETPLSELGAFSANHEILKQHLAHLVNGLDAHFSEPVHNDARRQKINTAIRKVFEADKAIAECFEGLE